ncbi:MAG: DedA family protein [Chitinophagales bacterium]|nr:DedA family protein [Chitinophagales bacterium]
MQETLEFLLKFTNPEFVIQYGGLTLLLTIVFIESGLFFGFFLPGDSLLFTAGLLTSTGHLHTPIYFLLLYIMLACTVGSLVGYLFGFRMGTYLDHKKDTLFFKKKHINLTRGFYEKHDRMTFVVGRFLPIIRTFVPIIAGMIRMEWHRFMFLNVLGCVCWVSVMVLSGFFLGQIFPGIIHYLEYIVIALVVITIIPVIRTYLRERKRLKQLPEE